MGLMTQMGKPRVTFTEMLTIATLNTIPTLTYTPIANTVLLIVGNATFTTVGSSPPVSVSGKTLTWSSTSPRSGFDLNVGELVECNYVTNELYQ